MWWMAWCAANPNSRPTVLGNPISSLESADKLKYAVMGLFEIIVVLVVAAQRYNSPQTKAIWEENLKLLKIKQKSSKKTYYITVVVIFVVRAEGNDGSQAEAVREENLDKKIKISLLFSFNNLNNELKKN